MPKNAIIRYTHGPHGDSIAYLVVENDSIPDLEELMVDGSPTDDTNAGLPFIASDGDVNLGYQWRFVLLPAEMVTVGITYRVLVPEPATLLVALLGILLLPLRRQVRP